MTTDPRIVALVADLLFAARIRGAAPGAVVVQRPEALGEAVGPGTRLVLVDLQARGAVEALEGLNGTVGSGGSGGPRVVAFGPHVAAAALESARAAGAEAMPRGEFVRRLAELVAEGG